MSTSPARPCRLLFFLSPSDRTSRRRVARFDMRLSRENVPDGSITRYCMVVALVHARIGLHTWAGFSRFTTVANFARSGDRSLRVSGPVQQTSGPRDIGEHARIALHTTPRCLHRGLPCQCNHRTVAGGRPIEDIGEHTRIALHTTPRCLHRGLPSQCGNRTVAGGSMLSVVWRLCV